MSLADELNSFCARFDAENIKQVLFPQAGSEAVTLILEIEDVRWSFQKVNPKVASKLVDLGLETSLRRWILNCGW